MLKPFQTIDPDVARKLLEGHEDIITPAVKKEQERLSGITCPKCTSAGIQARVNAKVPFSNGSILPNKILSCLQCGTEFMPSGLIISG